MLLLPEVPLAGRKPKLPLSELSEGVLVRALLVPQQETRVQLWRQALLADPPLAIWAFAQAKRAAMAMADVASLARWLSEASLDLLAPLQQSPDERATFSEAQRKRLADLLVSSFQTGELAAQLAETSLARRVDEARLGGYLSHTGAWATWDDDTGASEGTLCLLAPGFDDGKDIDALVAETASALAAPSRAARPTKSDRKAMQAEARRAAARWWQSGAECPLLRLVLAAAARLRELETSFARAVEAEKLAALAEFAAGAGHEMNNPLAVISGRAQLLARHEGDPERRRELALVHAQALRVHEMIADLMLFARPPQPQCEVVDVASLLRQVAAELGPHLTGTGVRLTVDIGAPAGTLFEVQADRTQLAVAVRALLDNAVEAMGDAGELHIAASPGANGELPVVHIEITDTGPGFGDDVRRHLFDPYFSGRSAGRGLGLGLSKCWRIVSLHGGRLEVASTPGKGSRFTIVLPVRPPIGSPAETT
jgi:signal transduction histidine kinase